MGTLRGLWGASHPGPTLVVTVLALGLGWAAGLDPARSALLTAAVFCGQLSVGLSNDAIDAPRDRAVGRTDKPIARGEVGLAAAWAVAFAMLAASLLLSAALGWRMLAAHAVALGSAWAYNAGLKSTALSLVPFVVSFGIFPSLATLSALPPTFAPPWAWIAGTALGTAVHLTNVLPDLDQDAATGVRGLPHRWGPRISAVVAGCAVIAGAVAVLLGAAGGDLSTVPVLSWVFFVGVIVVAVVTLGFALLRPPTRMVFRLVMLAALLLAAQLIATGRALTG